MATTTKRYDARKALADYYVYAPLGAGQVLLEKSKELSDKAVQLAQSQREDWSKALAVIDQSLDAFVDFSFGLNADVAHQNRERIDRNVLFTKNAESVVDTFVVL